ncbi:hypothetical protein SAMN06264855_105101 [Halorubrum vacuolatum]|uniref:Uncharacterized protein n=2 Tax=Halorubrum vacuolatum TaxID=63740 RepID=A0A238W6D2_HALVU|nr:hypothetical protein SAMN06264855_105101 [Halorubrum vacuolatum]
METGASALPSLGRRAASERSPLAARRASLALGSRPYAGAHRTAPRMLAEAADPYVLAEAADPYV